MLSSYHHGNQIMDDDQKKPETIIDYNKYKGSFKKKLNFNKKA